MMVDARMLIGSLSDSEVPDRAAAAWDRINEHPTPITIIRSAGKTKSSRPAQTVRLEFSNTTTGQQVTTEAGTSSHQQVVVFGISGHDSEPDTDIQKDDQFRYAGLLYRVISVIAGQGEVQAQCEAVG